MSDILLRIERELQPKPSPVRRWSRVVTYAVLLCLVPILGAESLLRVCNYYRPEIPLEIQRATNEQCCNALAKRFNTDAFVPDRYLLWKHQPGSNVGGIPVNPLGILEPESELPQENTSIRVLCLGDSISAMTYRTYPEIAEQLIGRNDQTGPVRIVNGAVPGYSTEQGLRQLKRLLHLRPDLVTLCFGWSDHFPALNLPDKELGARNLATELAHRLFRRTRVYQWLAAPSDSRWSQPQTTSATLRVCPEEFEANLRDFVHTLRSNHAVAVLATQPENLTPESCAYFEKQRFVPEGVDLARIHREYNAIVRRVADQEHCPLMDLEEEFDRRNKSTLFEADGMHLSGPGQNLVARLLIGVLKNQKFLTRNEFEQIVDMARYDTRAPDKPRVSYVLQPMSRIEAQTTRTAQISVVAKNTGNTTWLRSNVVRRFGLRDDVRYGGVELVGYWRTLGASSTTAPAALLRLSHDLYPGESTSATLAFSVPAKPGEYEMEIGLRADSIGDLVKYGAEITTLTVLVQPG